MDKIRLLNSVYIIENGEEKLLSPSDIVINCFDEFMIFANYVGDYNKVYLDRLDYGKKASFFLPNFNRNDINIGTPMMVSYAEKNYSLISDISNGNLRVNITRLL
jgi:hypothetical protein